MSSGTTSTSTAETLSLPLRGSVAAACEACADRLVEDVRTLPGVQAAAFDPTSSALRIDFDARATGPDDLSTQAGAAADTLAQRYSHRSFRIGGMDCANCALSVEKSVRSLPGVTTAKVQFTASRLKVEHAAETPDVPSDQLIRERVEALGFSLAGEDAAPPDEEESRADATRRAIPLYASGALLALGLAAEHLFHAPEAVTGTLFGVSLLFGGYRFALAGLRALRTGTVGTNLLMALAAVGALFLNAWGEAAMVVFLYALGEHLERGAMERTRRSLRGLIDAAPATADRLRPDGSSEPVAASALLVGDRVLVRPGAKLPADGRIVRGASDITESAITGEPLPRSKEAGDLVYAGSVNGTGALTVEVTAQGDDTTLARILHLVEEAQARKAPVQAFVERFGRVYTPLVILAAVALAVFGPLVAPGPNYVYRALTLLVVACPCALVIATPVAYAAGIARAARSGILVKGGAVLESLAAARVAALDKTGTLTTGRPEVVSVFPIAADEEETLAAAAAVERLSEHPLADAVVREADARGVPRDLPEAHEVTSLPGRGISARVGGAPVLIGNETLMNERGIILSESARAEIERMQASGASVLLVARDDALLGAIFVADGLRPEAPEAVAELKSLGLTTTLLTGDGPAAGNAVGQRAGIGEVHASLLPQDKLRLVREHTARAPVVFVGDGINDAPALAASTVGVAMGAGGTAAAIEAADVALMESNLSRLPEAVRLARATRQVVRQNVFIALGAVGVLLAATFAGSLPLPLGVLGHEGSALLVIVNALRLASPRFTPLGGRDGSATRR